MTILITILIILYIVYWIGARAISKECKERGITIKQWLDEH